MASMRRDLIPSPPRAWTMNLPILRLPRGRTAGPDARPRAVPGPFLVEPLEDRVLLSRGLGEGEASTDPGPASDRSGSLAAAQPVEVRIADLAAEGVGVPVGAVEVRPGVVGALRFGDQLLIGGQLFQYASGPGYPLVPV